jgi:hypothetical protein
VDEWKSGGGEKRYKMSSLCEIRDYETVAVDFMAIYSGKSEERIRFKTVFISSEERWGCD